MGRDVTTQEIVGDGVTATYTLSAEVNTSLHVDLYIDGAHQQPSSYTVVLNQLTLLEVPHIGALITVKIGKPIGVGTTDALLVEYNPAGTGAVATTVQAKLRESVSVADFGTTGTADDTAVIQAAIDSLGTHGVLDGLGNTYIVTALNLKSNITLENFYLLTKSGSLPADFASPITIGAYGDTTTYSNIILRNIHVDGQRELNNTGCVGFAEDGGKHGFRFVGNVTNVLLENCSALLCGSYGIFLYGYGTCRVGTNTDNPLLYNITLRDCKFQFNKAHGMAVDSTRYLTIDNSSFIYNGLASGTDPAPLFTGHAYAGGIDIEGYGLGSWVGDVKISNCDLRYNGAKSLIFQDVVLQTDPEFDVRTNFDITNCNMDTGSEATRFDPDCAFQMTAPAANWSLGDLYRNVTVNGGTITGEVLLADVSNVVINTLQSTGTVQLGTIVWGGNILVINGDVTKTFITAQATVYYNPKPVSAVASVGGFLQGGFNLNGIRIQYCYSAPTAFLANEEKNLTATFQQAFPTRTLLAVPFIASVTATSDVKPPRSPGGTTTTAACTIQNGATPQTITIGFFVIGE